MKYTSLRQAINVALLLNSISEFDQSAISGGESRQQLLATTVLMGANSSIAGHELGHTLGFRHEHTP